MTRRAMYLFFLVFCLSLAGCKQEFDDISSDINFSHLINTEYQSIHVLRIQGINLDTDYRKKIDKYTVMKYPGSDGPEVISIGQLAVGTLFKIKKVLRCNNCFFFSPISIIVEINAERLEANIPVMLYGLRIKGAGGRIMLDPMFFKKLL